MFEVYGVGEPVRLFVGGLHGNEGIITKPILRNVSAEVSIGTLVIWNLSRRSRYVSTLDPRYCETVMGKKLLSLISKYRPEIYIELHSYGKNAYLKLTNHDRIAKVGVPSMVELEDGILIGSVSPHLRVAVFSRDSLCLTLEIPKNMKDQSKVIRILDEAAKSTEKTQFLDELRRMYPEQLKMAEEKFRDYFKELEPF